MRVVGHTPKPDHYTYEIVLDFTDGSERVNAKLYRGKSGSRAHQDQAKQEAQNLHFAHQTATKRKLNGVPRPGRRLRRTGRGREHQSKWPAVAEHHHEGGAAAGRRQPCALLESSAKQAGEWLQQFHKATAGMPTAMDADAIMAEFEKLCAKARKDGLPEDSTDAIMANAKSVLSRHKRPLRTSAVLAGLRAAERADRRRWSGLLRVRQPESAGTLSAGRRYVSGGGRGPGEVSFLQSQYDRRWCRMRLCRPTA